MSFRAKTILGIALIESLLLLFLVWTSLTILYSSSEQALYERSETMTRLLASTTKDAVLSTDLASLKTYVDEVITNPGVAYVRVRDEERVLAEAGAADVLARDFHADRLLDAVDDGIYDASQPISEAGIVFGSVELGMSVVEIQRTFDSARAQTVGIAVLEIVLVALFSFVLGSYLTRQLSRLSDAAARIADGGPGAQVEVNGHDELAQTSHAFNLMSARLKASYDQLRDAYHTVMAGVSDGIVTVDADGIVRECNTTAEKLLGLAPGEADGWRVSVLIPGFDFIAAEGTHREASGRRRDGLDVPLDVSVSRFQITEGERPLYTLIARDMSERKEAERRLAETARQLESQNRQLQDFAYVASHDLQEPLRKVQTYGDILVEECGDAVSEDGRHYIARIRDSAARMQTLIADLLAYSRVATHAQPAEEVALDKLLDEVLIDLEIAVQESDANIERGVLPRVRGDRTQLRQVFQNLVANAIKFRASDRPLRIDIAAQVVLGDDGEPTHQRIIVEDNGIGFDQQFAENVFKVFERLHARHRYPGTGIGLAICKRVVERHGGTIEAHSEVDSGTRFVILLPVAPPGAEADDSKPA